MKNTKKLSEKQIKESKEIRQKVENCFNQFYSALCDEQGYDYAAVSLAVLLYAEEEIFQHECLDRAFVIICQTALAVYMNEQNLKNGSDSLISEDLLITGEIH